MVRAFDEILRLAGHDTSRRRRHQFVPTVGESSSCLEDRALLNGAGGSAQAAAAHLADTPAGRHVTHMYEHIFGTAPTGPQLRHFVHEVRAGRSLAALHRQLVVEARAQARAAAASGAIPMTNSSFGAAARRSGVLQNRGLGSLRGQVTGAPNLPASFVAPFAARTEVLPVTRTVSATFPATTRPTGINTALAANNGGFSSLSALNLGTSNVPITARTGIATGTIGTTGTTVGTVLNSPTGTAVATTTGSPLTSLVTGGTVATPGLTTTTAGTTASTLASTLGALALQTAGTVPTGTLVFTPATFANSPVNGTPTPMNGVLPFTGTPVNPSPIPVNGALPLITL